ncbi:MAG TPA: T9SS type A sorting domain-containing protein [Bacteroidia bacterium]|jgi:hypothetical protein|nr:T9SS type A sorting domain-containing protein [Bacteroidia bacterium]
MKKNLLLLFGLAISFTGIAQTTSSTFSYTGGVQTFTVPPCVTSVNIEARGAQGGAVTNYSPYPQGGLGATLIGDFAVTPGDVLTIIVGGRGNSDPSSSGGGGGSGVNNGTTVLIVAGGGGGADFQDPSFAGQDAVISNNGVTGNSGGGAGGTGGNSGGDIIYTSTNISRGGKGWNDGNSGSTGLNGVSTNTTYTLGTWGLGGGGGSVGYGYCNCGGGGGGYSGGGSGQINHSGGGGGSYNIGTNQSNTAGNNSGNGQVIISYVVGVGTPASPSAVSGSSSVCEGVTGLIYSITAVPGATGYSWTVPSGSTITGGQGTTSITVSAGSTSGNVTVTADNACGSSAPTTFALTINPSPSVTATAATPDICTGSSDVLTAGGAVTYSWSSGGTASTETVSPTSMTTYTVTGTDGNGCVNTAMVTVNVNPLPTVTGSAAINSVCLDDADVALTGTPNGGTWSGTGVTGNNFSPSTAGSGTFTLTYSYTDVNSCSNTATVSITVDLCMNASANASLSGINIYPNPSEGQFTIEFAANINDADIVITDLEGRVVYQSRETGIVSGQTKQIDLGNESAGIYLMSINADGGMRTDKISIAK